MNVMIVYTYRKAIKDDGVHFGQTEYKIENKYPTKTELSKIRTKIIEKLKPMMLWELTIINVIPLGKERD